jgi:hypothetical protein
MVAERIKVQVYPSGLAREIVPGEVALRARLRFNHDRLVPYLGKLVGDDARRGVDDSTRWIRQDQVDAPVRKVGLRVRRR